MGAASRGGRQSGFNMGAAQNYYADDELWISVNRVVGLTLPVTRTSALG